MSESAYRRLLNTHDDEIIKLRNGLYASVDALAGGMVDIDAIVPGGILCLYSAWHHYKMTTQIPDAYYVAIDRKRKVTLPAMPAINTVFTSKHILDIGKTHAKIEGYEVLIYDRERCICDAIKYRNKIGINVMAEILNSYLKSPGADYQKLYTYARNLRVGNILSRYLEFSL